MLVEAVSKGQLLGRAGPQQASHWEKEGWRVRVLVFGRHRSWRQELQDGGEEQAMRAGARDSVSRGMEEL